MQNGRPSNERGEVCLRERERVYEKESVNERERVYEKESVYERESKYMRERVFGREGKKYIRGGESNERVGESI